MFLMIVLKMAAYFLVNASCTLCLKFVKSSWLYYFRSYSWYFFRREELALRDIEAAVALKPDNLKARRLAGLYRIYRGQYTETIMMLAPYVKEKPRDTVAVHNLAIAYYNLSDYDAAKATLLPLAKEDDITNIRIVELLAYVLYKLKDNAQTQSMLMKALDNGSTEPGIAIRLGTILLEEGEPAKALPYLERAFPVYAHEEPAYCVLATAYHDTGNYAACADIARKGLALFGASQELNGLLSSALEKLATDK